jgi:asparagine synthase (glutamine-hydrolysing)
LPDVLFWFVRLCEACMCGIVGMFDTRDLRRVAPSILGAMAESIWYRGPDDVGFHVEAGVGLGSRRLSIIDLLGGHQPICNEDGTVWVAFNGELFDYPELREKILSRGHRLRTRCDTESVVHLWEDYGTEMFEHLRGQFAFALWDSRDRTLILARDRVGICPLFWSHQDGWLLYGSEIKALLASGMVAPRPDVRGIDHLFSYFCQPGERTCFAGVQSLLPGHYLTVRHGVCKQRRYWDLDFPERGGERISRHEGELVDEFESVLSRAVKRRLHAEVPVASYLSGGVDSAVITALMRRHLSQSFPSFTVRVGHDRFDETAHAAEAAEAIGVRPVVVPGELSQIGRCYPDLIQAAEAPVLDSTCACMLMQARAVNSHGYKVVLSGEGADEALAGYAWFKSDRLRQLFESVTGLWPEVVNWFLRPMMPWLPTLGQVKRIRQRLGGMPAQQDIHNLMSAARQVFYSPRMWQELDGHSPLDDLHFDAERIRRWHPLNRSLYFNYKFMLPGMLLNQKGDRVTMRSSIEARYPFLDDDVITFCAALDTKYKLRRMREKWLLRRVATRLLPRPVATRSKKMFRAPMWGVFAGDDAPPFVNELLSPAALSATGYFSHEAVTRARQMYPRIHHRSPRRVVLDMGLLGVLGTQIWHHLFIDGSLADLPYWSHSWKDDDDPRPLSRMVRRRPANTSVTVAV